MRQLAGSCLSDELLQTLWLQRLPNQAQAILSVSDDKLDKLALMADKILETTEQAGSNCYAVAQTPPADQIVVLQQQVAELAKQMQSLTRAQTPNLARGTRFRSKSRNRNTLRNNNGICWYHLKFGQQATECKEPCNFARQGN